MPEDDDPQPDETAEQYLRRRLNAAGKEEEEEPMRFNDNPMQRDVPPHDPEPDVDQQFGEAIAAGLSNSRMNAFSRHLSGEDDPDPEPSPEQRRADALREAHHALRNQQQQEEDQS